LRTPQLGDFGLTKGKGLAMFAIRHGTASRYGHACVALYSTPTNKVIIIEAMPDGARSRVVDVDEFVWSNLSLTDEQRRVIGNKAEQCIGLPYDWKAIVGFVIRVWKARWSTGSDDHADDKLICSELVAWAYREAGFDLAPGVAPGDVSPGDLADWLFRRSLERV
jgi:uncharacterized protein YycO